MRRQWCTVLCLLYVRSVLVKKKVVEIYLYLILTQRNCLPVPTVFDFQSILFFTREISSTYPVNGVNGQIRNFAFDYRGIESRPGKHLATELELII